MLRAALPLTRPQALPLHFSFCPRPLVVRFLSSSTSAAAAPASPPTLRILHSHIHDPYFNIAVEERLMAGVVQAELAKKAQAAGGADATSAPSAPSPSASSSPFSLLRPSTHTLFLWNNSPCVIMGKHQNPHREVHLDALRQAGVNLVRRHSGGGCVYQDRGNAIFSFVSRDTPENKEQHNRILISALEELGIQAETSGRNDIHTGGKKISGCAFKREKGWLLHHGTMLVDVDMLALPRLLNPSKAKLQAKGVASVAARVVNLKQLKGDITTDVWDKALTKAFLKEHGASLSGEDASESASAPRVEVEHMRRMEDWLLADPGLAAAQSLLRSWEWIYGHTPEFTHEFSHRFEGWAGVDVCFRVGRGLRVEEAKAYSDALQPQLIDLLNRHLGRLVVEGCNYEREQVERVLVAAEEESRAQFGEEAANNLRQLREWLLAHL